MHEIEFSKNIMMGSTDSYHYLTSEQKKNISATSSNYIKKNIVKPILPLGIAIVISAIGFIIGAIVDNFIFPIILAACLVLSGCVTGGLILKLVLREAKLLEFAESREEKNHANDIFWDKAKDLCESFKENEVLTNFAARSNEALIAAVKALDRSNKYSTVELRFVISVMRERISAGDGESKISIDTDGICDGALDDAAKVAVARVVGDHVVAKFEQEYPLDISGDTYELMRYIKLAGSENTENICDDNLRAANFNIHFRTISELDRIIHEAAEKLNSEE